ncbi:MAG: transcription elongation factor GreB [Gammaproteobacteria bacterium]|nr:transcription elongation factor GreB [Gammaproteobacteria bacterium]
MTQKHYITPQGANKLRQELNHLWKVVRPEVTRKVSAAAALGDRSENADYIYGKKQLREIDSRVRYLRKRLEDIEVVTALPDNRERVYFGAFVKLEDENGEISTLRIVGADEYDPKKNWISLHSPVAKSLLGKNLGDSVLLNRPIGAIEACIIDIEYRTLEGNED